MRFFLLQEVSAWEVSLLEYSDVVAADPVVEANREALLQRSNLGIKKYGVMLNRDDLSLRDWLEHALQETLDQANYLQAAIHLIDRQSTPR